MNKSIDFFENKFKISSRGEFMDILLDTLKDTYLVIPVLFIMYLCLEYFEHKQDHYSYDLYLHKYGPLLGALLGMIPQCGFGVLASVLFIENKITLGTLISVFIATSDEAIPLLLTNPHMYSSLISIILLKLIIGIIAGYIIDFLFKKETYQYDIQTYHSHSHSPIVEALKRTFKIYFFIFIVNLILSYFIETIGTDSLSTILMDRSMIQPIVSALFGFIPNCAASVILTRLYMNQVLSFASLLAGLITNAGLGILALIQNKVEIKIILKICLILLIVSLCITLPIQWFYLMG